MSHPTDDLVRRLVPKIELRADNGGPPTMFGHFAVFNQWTEIDSLWEGPFLERIAPGAFKKTFRENRSSFRVLYDHGFGPIGNMQLGTIQELKEDDRGAYYETKLFPALRDEAPLLMEGLEAGAYGASFRFSITKQDWEKGENGDMDKRTIQEVRLYEFGPVTFPAYEAATAGVRSRADMALWERLDKPGRAELVRLMMQARDNATPAADGTGAGEQDQEPAGATPFLDKAREALERSKEEWAQPRSTT